MLTGLHHPHEPEVKGHQTAFVTQWGEIPPEEIKLVLFS